jgi:multicomponent Na+:H+ antiporter subunit E
MMKNIIISAILVYLSWLMLNGNIYPSVLLSGLVVTAVIALFFSTRHPVFKDVKLNPRAIAAMVAYVFVFTGELLKANIDVASRVLSPSLPVNPGIVEIKTDLKSEIGRLALANSITLTPGTLTVDVKDDSLFIHWIDVTDKDVEGATRKIASTFEKYLGVIYG